MLLSFSNPDNNLEEGYLSFCYFIKIFLNFIMSILRVSAILYLIGIDECRLHFNQFSLYLGIISANFTKPS